MMLCGGINTVEPDGRYKNRPGRRTADVTLRR